MPIDILALWNFQNPAESEQRFHDAMDGASEDEKLSLETQIARTYGLRKDFDKGKTTLHELMPRVVGRPEPEARCNIELGRAYC